MNQNGKHISARIRDSESRKRNTGVVPNYLKFVNNIFNLERFYFVFSRLSLSKHSLVV
ncbi:hypothetical protein ACSAZL_14300 [Methanosarcina sp. T3]|uniref:hypothetical protein n=1 Tax=Methanosarcina sp. T3 TaxID=3439062 RepID=UPI003F832025